VVGWWGIIFYITKKEEIRRTDSLTVTHHLFDEVVVRSWEVVGS
jgi:hypothetical protein